MTITSALCDRALPGSLPCDIRLWVDEESLMQRAWVAASLVAEGHFPPNLLYGPSKSIPPRMLLALITYSYAAGVFSSREIVKRLSEDAMPSFFPVNAQVDQSVLRVFRRRWRQLIKQCLVILFQMAWNEHSLNLISVNPSEVASSLTAADSNGHRQFEKEFIGEAESRLLRAILYDTAEADD